MLILKDKRISGRYLPQQNTPNLRYPEHWLLYDYILSTKSAQKIAYSVSSRFRNNFLNITLQTETTRNGLQWTTWMISMQIWGDKLSPGPMMIELTGTICVIRNIYWINVSLIALVRYFLIVLIWYSHVLFGYKMISFRFQTLYHSNNADGLVAKICEYGEGDQSFNPWKHYRRIEAGRHWFR